MFDFDKSVCLPVFEPCSKRAFCLLLVKICLTSLAFSAVFIPTLPLFSSALDFISIKHASMTFFSESPLNTNTRIIRTLWHVPLVVPFKTTFSRFHPHQTNSLQPNASPQANFANSALLPSPPYTTIPCTPISGSA